VDWPLLPRTVAWGIIYAVLRASLPGTPVVKSLIFAALAWLAMMMAAMRALERAPWQGEFDPIEGIILHGAMPDHPAAAEEAARQNSAIAARPPALTGITSTCVLGCPTAGYRNSDKARRSPPLVHNTA